MAIHVLIKRKWQVGDTKDLFPLLTTMSEKAKKQAGHLSSQILRSAEDQNDYVVISRWESNSTWEKWLASSERREIQAKIDSLIGEKTFFEIYETVDADGSVVSGTR